MRASSIAEPHKYPPGAEGNERGAPSGSDQAPAGKGAGSPGRETNLSPASIGAGALVGFLAVAALSLLVVTPAPSYDPWSWLLWGREVAGGELHTSEGPALKPLPVAVCAALSLLGSAAPLAWVLIARVGAVLAIVLAFRLGRRLSSGSALAGGLAAAGVALCGGYLSYASSGLATGWLLALALGGVEAWRAGRPRLALACAVGCGLLQVETWPFLAALGVVLWRRRPEDRPSIASVALAVPALWFVPELLGSGDILRSATRARIPNEGQPALADVPGLASMWEAVQLPLWPLWVGVAALATTVLRSRAGRRRRVERGTTGTRALVPAAVGLAWIAIVAAMAQLGGFSGEPRYALPGMALIAVSGAVGLVTAGRPGDQVAAGGLASPRRPGAQPASGGLAGRRRPGAQPASGGLAGRRRPGAQPASGGPAGRRLARVALLAATGLLALAAAPRLDDVVALRDAQSYQWELQSDLADAIAAAGGRDALLSCGQPYVGRFRGPLAAYRLDVPKHAVEPDLTPAAPGVVLSSRLHRGAPVLPAASPPFAELARTERWRVLQACER